MCLKYDLINDHLLFRMLVEHWIRAKYEWREFHVETVQIPVYLKGKCSKK